MLYITKTVGYQCAVYDLQMVQSNGYLKKI